MPASLLCVKLLNEPRNIRHRLDIKPHVMTMLIIPTIWRRNPVNINMVEIMTLIHPVRV